jgi:hypothetical protein
MSALDSLMATRFCELRGELGHLRGQEVGPVRDRVVVEHAGQWRRADHRGDVVLHLAPVARVDIGRQHHQAAAARFGRRAGQGDRLAGGQRRDAGDDRPALAHRLHGGLEHRFLLRRGEGRRLAERAQRHDRGAARVHHHPAVLREERVVDRAVGLEGSRDRGDDAVPENLLHRASG